jgi:hypothetical protein
VSIASISLSRDCRAPSVRAAAKIATIKKEGPFGFAFEVHRVSSHE